MSVKSKYDKPIKDAVFIYYYLKNLMKIFEV